MSNYLFAGSVYLILKKSVDLNQSARIDSYTFNLFSLLLFWVLLQSFFLIEIN
jgi:hypothetical protein